MEMTLSLTGKVDRNYAQREAINTARHLIKKTASELGVDEREVISMVTRPQPIKLFELDDFLL